MLRRTLLVLSTGPLGVLSFGVRRSGARADERRSRAGYTVAKMAVSDLRKDYGAKGLEDADAGADPIDMFQTWFDEACAAEVLEPNAMCLSTVDKESGRPSARYVLLKGFDERGFVWYTNYGSRKAAQLADNPFASLTFWWGDLERSIRIEGRVEKVSEEESLAYFRSRPRGSQVGALVSDQSQEIESREALDAKAAALKAQYMPEGVPEEDWPEVPMPNWGGYRLEPDRIEFWKGRSSRVHDRIVYTKAAAAAAWEKQRLQP